MCQRTVVTHYWFPLLAIATLLATPSGMYAQAVADRADAASPAKPRLLFNGKTLDGWTYYLGESDKKMEEVWSVADGVLRCTGTPSGYLITRQKNFANYHLSVDWRWPGKPGNNGVLVHCSKKNALGVWPKSLEVQLAHENAGDFWVIGTEITIPNVDQRREGRRHLNLTDDSEKPLGEWNRMEIVCRGDEVTVHVNGDLVNHCTGCSEQSGAIALQSEGAPIEYRNIKLTPLAER
jgi:hypothetical protein